MTDSDALLAALDCTELATDARFSDNVSRVANRTVLLAELVPRLKRRGADEWFGILAERGVPAGPINDMVGVFTDPQGVARGMRISPDGVPGVRSPRTFSGAELALDRASPQLGEHQDELPA